VSSDEPGWGIKATTNQVRIRALVARTQIRGQSESNFHGKTGTPAIRDVASSWTRSFPARVKAHKPSANQSFAESATA
jgi:hypothetical protein